jgi:cell division protein FtsN
MSLHIPNDYEGHNHSEKEKRGSIWALVILLVVALSVFMYRYTNIIAPGYYAVGMYHPPDTRPVRDLEGEHGDASKRAVQLKTEPAPPTQQTAPTPQVTPTPAPSASKTNVGPAAPTISQSPESKPVQILRPQPRTQQASPAKPYEKAAIQPATQPNGEAKKTREPVNTTRKAAKPVVKTDSYTLLIGELPSGQDMTGLRAKIKKLGITPIHEKPVKKLDSMHRLFLASFSNHETAVTELQKLRQLTPGAFIAKENGKYAVYAGSYHQKERADAEKQRLAAKNIRLNSQTVQMSVSLNRVVAGSFSASAAAHKHAKDLRKQGINARVIKAEH